MKNYEVLVVGGGLAGMSAALACQNAGLNVAIIAKKPAKNDGRTTALFMPSVEFLNELGVWEKIKDQTAALKTMRILDSTNRLIRSRPASFPSSEIGLDAFGYNFPNHPLLVSMYEEMAETDIELIESLVELFNANPKLYIQNDLILDVLIGHAVRIAWMKNNSKKEYDEHKGEAWNAFYKLSVIEAQENFMEAFSFLIQEEDSK